MADEVSGQEIIEDLAAPVLQRLVAEAPAAEHGEQVGAVATLHQHGGALVDRKLPALETGYEGKLGRFEVPEHGKSLSGHDSQGMRLDETWRPEISVVTSPPSAPDLTSFERSPLCLF